MRSGAGAAKGGGQGTGDSGADDAAGKHAAGIGGGERDGALGDERETHDVVHDAGVAVGLGPAVLEERGGEGDRDGRNHAADHDGGHDDLARGAEAGAGVERGGAKDVSGLVEGAAHVDGHHAAEHEAEHDDVARAETLEESVKAGVDEREDRVEAEHDDADGENAEHRVEQRGLDTLERLGQLVAGALDAKHDVAGREARKQRGDEAAGHQRGLRGIAREVRGEADVGEAVARLGDKAAHEARGKAGAVGDGGGDVGREDRQHEAKRLAADGLEERRRRDGRAVGGGAKARLVDEERDGGEDAAADHERQHVGDAVHEVLVDLATHGLLLACDLGGSSGAAGVVVHGSLALEDDVDELLGLVDAARDGAAVEGLAVKATELDVLVGGDDDALGARDVGGREHVLGTARALRLHLDADAHLLGGLVKALGGHVGVGDARGAGRDGDHVVAAVLGGVLLGGLLVLLGIGHGGLGGLLDGNLGALRLVDHGAELLGGLGGAEVVTELLVHEQHGQAGEHLEVDVGLGVGCGDEEHERRGPAVGRVVVDALGQRHGGEARSADRGRLGVRDGNALAKRRGALGLAGVDGRLVALDVGDVALLAHELDELVDGIALAGGGTSDLDGFRLEQIVDSHASPLSHGREPMLENCPTERGGRGGGLVQSPSDSYAMRASTSSR